MTRLTVLAFFTLFLTISSAHNVHAAGFGGSNGLSSFYYLQSCPKAVSTISSTVRNAVSQNPRVGAQLIRLLFHDCFVQGCDASILIDATSTSTAEKDAVPNSFFFIFDLVDQIKAAVEAVCPKTVSCADIIAYSAASSVSALGGPFIDIQGGRLDGFVSNSAEPLTNIPSPLSNLATLEASFSGKGLNTKDLVLLSGAHTVGKGHCGAFTNRLWNGTTSAIDPTLNTAYAQQLQAVCPSTPDPNTVVDMDPITPTFFDTGYLKDVQAGKGLFTSDAALYTGDAKGVVDQFANSLFSFDFQFAQSMKKMGAIGIKQGSNGNVRSNCRSFA